jgi:hypothetical protein
MDIGLYVAVLRRHRRALLIGLGAAILLALLASFRVSLSPPKLTLKLLPTYSTTSEILVTQAGAPTSRVRLTSPNDPRDQTGQVIPSFGDPARFEYLAQLYAQLANSYVIKQKVIGKDGFQLNNKLVLDGGKISGTYTAAAYTTDQGSLPIVSIVSSSTSEAASNEIAERATTALQGYLESTQRAASIPPKDRVELVVVTPPNLAKHVKGRPVIMPLAVFVLVLLATGLVVFFIENVRRDAQPAEVDETLREETPVDIRSVDPPTVKAPTASGRESRRERARRAAVVESVPRPRPRTLGETERSPNPPASAEPARVAQGGSAAGAEPRERPR